MVKRSRNATCQLGLMTLSLHIPEAWRVKKGVSGALEGALRALIDAILQGLRVFCSGEGSMKFLGPCHDSESQS